MCGRASTRYAHDTNGTTACRRTNSSYGYVTRRQAGANPVGAIKISKTYAGPFRDEDKRQQSRFFRAVSIRSPCSFERARDGKKKKRDKKRLQGRERVEVKTSLREVGVIWCSPVVRKIEIVKMFRFAVIGALFVVSGLAAPASQDAAALPPSSILEEALDVYTSCSEESSIAVCLKLKALRYVDRAARSADIEVIDGFKIVQTEEAKNR